MNLNIDDSQIIDLLPDKAILIRVVGKEEHLIDLNLNPKTLSWFITSIDGDKIL